MSPRRRAAELLRSVTGEQWFLLGFSLLLLAFLVLLTLLPGAVGRGGR